MKFQNLWCTGFKVSIFWIRLIGKYFLIYLIEKICCVYSLKAPLQALLMSSHNMCFSREIRKIINNICLKKAPLSELWIMFLKSSFTFHFQNQLYPSQQSMIKMEPNVSRQDVVQSPDSLTGNVYSDNIESYPNEGRSYSQQDSMARSQPQSVEMYKSQAVQPPQSVISSTQSNLQSTNLFYENAINKDSELKLSMKDRQALMNEGNSSNDLNMGIVSTEEVVSTEGGNSARGRLDLNLGQSDAPDLANRPISSDKTHVCMTCFKAFKNKPQLTQHELVHNGIRKHTCSYCDKSFKQLCHLNQHIRTHTGLLETSWLQIRHFFQLKSMVNALKFQTPKCLTKWHMQTGQTQIRLLQKEQSD